MWNKCVGEKTEEVIDGESNIVNSHSYYCTPLGSCACSLQMHGAFVIAEPLVSVIVGYCIVIAAALIATVVLYFFDAATGACHLILYVL